MPTDASAGGRIGRYIIIGRLGAGGMGVVVEAFDPELDRRVAVKLINPRRARARGSQRLIREAQAMARLSHTNVVQVYDVGVDGDQVFVAMELVRGRTLSKWLAESERTWQETLEVFIQAGRGIAAAHAAGLVHRDLKPDNILIAQDGRTCVADFGLAIPYDDLDDDDATLRGGDPLLNTPLTATGAAVGTPVYMSPEQHAVADVDARSDQFSFCVALCEALYGERPFRGASIHEIARRATAGDYVVPTHLERAPARVWEVIRRGLAPEPDDRFSDFDALLAALGDEPRRPRWPWVAGIGVAVSGVVAAGAIALAGESCERGQDELSAVWGPAQHASVAAAYGATDIPATVGQRVTDTLDAYGQRWVDAHRSTCEAHHEGIVSQAQADRSRACLQRGRFGLERVVELVASGDEAVLRGAPMAAASLPLVTACADPLATEAPVPDDPEAADAVQTLRRQIVQAEVTHHAGALADAQAELANLESTVSETAYAPLSAELALVRGRLAMDRRDYPAAADHLRQALAISLEVGADLSAAEAAARKLFVDGVNTSGLERVLAEASVAEGLVDRVGAPPALSALFTNNLGAVHAMGGDAARAAEHFERALELADGSAAVYPVDLANYHLNLALVTEDPAARDGAFARAREVLVGALGEEHIRVVRHDLQRARYITDPTASLAVLAPACEEARARLPDDYFGCYACASDVAARLEALDRTGEAVAALEIAAACFDGDVAELDREYADVKRLMAQGHAALLRGDAEDALSRLGRAHESLQPHAEAPHIKAELAAIEGMQEEARAGLQD